MAEELKLALIQAPLVWESPQANREAFSRAIRPLYKNTDLILLPEMFTTGFTMNPENVDSGEGLKTLGWMKEEASASGAALCGSMAFHDSGKYYNRLFFVTPSADITTYDKRHTFTFAGEDRVYASGHDITLIDFRGFRLCPLICYDLRFPVWSRNTKGYDLLLFVANWPSKRVQAWDTLLKARAIENMAYCAGLNRVGTDPNGHTYSGHSAVYDCLGNQLVYSESETTLRVTLSKAHIIETRESLKFLEDRDSFTLEP